jgi:uncharacterized membrane protein YphA (DoxX/SURF4 family)
MLDVRHIDWTNDRRAHRVSSKMVFGVVTAVVCAAFLGSGIANLVHAPSIAADMAHLGYPAYFSTILGAWKVLGAIAIAAPRLRRLKEWAYAGMIFDLSGAVFSRAVSGDGFAGVAPPAIIAALVVASWALRPNDRTFASPAAGGVSR